MFLQESINVKLTDRYSILSHMKQSCFGTWNLEKVKVGGFKCIKVHSKQGNFWKKETIILYHNMSLNTILSTDIYVTLEQELCFPNRHERYYRSGIVSLILALFGKYCVSRYQGNLARFYTIFLSDPGIPGVRSMGPNTLSYKRFGQT